MLLVLVASACDRPAPASFDLSAARLARLTKRGAELVGEVTQYEDAYRLCYIRGPEGILIGLAQEIGRQT